MCGGNAHESGGEVGLIDCGIFLLWNGRLAVVYLVGSIMLILCVMTLLAG